MADDRPPPGWYPHPSIPNTQRFWDGTAWTDKTRKKPRAKKSGRNASTRPVPRPQKGRPVSADKKGFWASLAPDPNVLASGLVDNTTTMKIYKDGTFTTKGVWGAESTPDRLLGFDHDIDSMRRKSATGRGAAAMLTGGAALLASNNRGVVYVTVTGANTNVRTYTTRNPSGTTLSSIRGLKAAADTLIAHGSSAKTTDAPAAGGDMTAQLKQLADLHAAGALSDAEFASAKARLLG